MSRFDRIVRRNGMGKCKRVLKKNVETLKGD